MKKKITVILLPLISMLLGACAFIPPAPSSQGSSTPSSESSSSSSTERKLKNTKLVDTHGEYVIGDVFQTASEIKLLATYNDGYTEYLDPDSYEVTSMRIKDTTQVLDYAQPFLKGATYEVFLSYVYDEKTKAAKIEINVLNGYEAGLALNDFVIEDFNYMISKSLLETLAGISFIASWENGVDEELVYSENVDLIEVALYKDGSNTNTIENPIEQNSSYVFEAYIKGYESKKVIKEFVTTNALGYYRLDKGDIIYEDFTTVSPHEGVANTLVIPIELESEEGTKPYSWTDEYVERAEKYFFGEREETVDEWNSLETYFETTSLNMVDIQGRVATVYRPSESLFTLEGVDESYNALHACFNAAVEFVKEHDTDIVWSEYDLNEDGYIDNLHFITNAGYEGNATWPHKYSIYNNPGTPNNPNAYVYETTTLGHFEDSSTIIHEQSHMFGIPDYYDYSYAGVNYVGCLDMQSHNVFDWNSWSKFSVGWGGAIVVDGTLDSVTISLKSAAIYNECLIIPADISTYNNSAFDEFFMLELFTADGNNARDWKRYISSDESRSAGIRLYHVDARLYSYHSDQEVETKEELMSNLALRRESVDVGVNNSYVASEYAIPGYSKWYDFKLLALIQKGGVDEFGTIDETTGKLAQLKYEDLFLTGDSFVFEDYAHFLSKSHKTITTMDNGETFPYAIDFLSVNRNEALIKITKR